MSLRNLKKHLYLNFLINGRFEFAGDPAKHYKPNMELNRIYHENCIDTMNRLTDEFVDMTLTSPPYDNLREYNGYQFPVEEIARSLFRITKNGGVAIWVVGDRTVNGDETLSSFEHAFAFRDAGFKVHDTMIYAKNNPIPSDCGRRYRQAFEYMFCFAKGTPKTFNPITEPTKSAGEKIKAFRHILLQIVLSSFARIRT